MAQTNDNNKEEEEELHENKCSFQWDETSQLYYHASGFYHDPNAGWYYNSRDGSYYKFEDGNYVLLESEQGDESDVCKSGTMNPDNSVQDEPFIRKDMNFSLVQGGESEAYKEKTILDELGKEQNRCIDSDLHENPPPPSEWLEDTLIELYLSGYSNEVTKDASDVAIPMETDHMDSLNLSVDGAANDDTYELEEGEWIPDENHDPTDSSGSCLDEDVYRDEENWRAQYGQVIKSDEDSSSLPAFPVVDLWDWEIVKGTKKGGKDSVYRLVGRLVRRSTKLHPSMPSGGNVLKTAPICEAHLDLVRVTSGQVYKLRNPRARYLASLSMYDSSNLTKDWGFPELSIEKQIALPKSTRNSESKTRKAVPVHKDPSLPPEHFSGSQMNRSNGYRDRAAERRALHGGFGVGPGQKKSTAGIYSEPSSPVTDVCPEEAAVESLNMSFGAGSYARRLLEGMGWKEGEALGDSMKGLTEPLKAVGNKGNAGLGWDLNARKL